MTKIPKAQPQQIKDRIKPAFHQESKDDTVVFSFSAVDKNEYFNLDSTCQNWAQDLFATMQIVSKLSIKEIYAGKFSSKGSTLRIHQHQDAESPCDLPNSVLLEDMWQIRISKSKGGIHGVFYENIFYIIWFDPHHNLYPDDRYGGLKKIKPPDSCCKDRDCEIEKLNKELKQVQEYNEFLESYVKELEKK